MQPDSQFCTSCGEETPAAARFCPNCGIPMANRVEAPSDSGGEHRQITVMFCDLAGSTALSNRLDPEDLRDLLRTYQGICAEAIEARSGMIAQYLGDGVLAYFGYPKASENAAVDATDAAIDIASRVEKTGAELLRQTGADFSTRIALHTGRVLIGEMGAGQTRDRHALTGVVPNLAARLEQLAPRNGVVISADTCAMVSGAFRIESLGEHDLKGFSEPIEAFRVLGRQHAMPVLPACATPLIGRERELGLLADAWARVSASESRTVSIVAEPGMGKSALAAAFASSTGLRQTRLIEISGALSDRNTPFACLRQTMKRWTALGRIHDGKTPDQQIARWFGVDDVSSSRHAETFFRLLQDEIEHGQEGRARIFAACTARVASLTKPVLIVAEDAHWLDPSTAEILHRITAENAGVMLLRLLRPGFESDTAANGVTISLSALDLEDSRRLIANVVSGPVDLGVARFVTEVAGGLPLFIEEFTKSLIDASLIRRERGVFRLASLQTKVATPASLIDLITVRLDALGEAKELAQVCAVLGRSFGRNALAAVIGEPAEEMNVRIDRLIDAGILAQEWSGSLTFRHALFQTAAYESLVRAARQRWHGRFLEWLRGRPNLMAETPPETIAFHLEACGRNREAVDYYFQAGVSADKASASSEAAAHYGRCCDLLAGMAEEEDLGALPLRAQVMLAGALLSARGPGAAETRSAYEAAIGLADRLPESEWHFAAYWGWWRVSDSFLTMAQRARTLLEKSKFMQGLEFKLQAQHCMWANAFQMGDFHTSIDSARKGLSLYDQGSFDGAGTHYGGHDCKVCALGEIGLASWLQGAGDAAQTYVEAAIIHAEKLDHLGSLLHALDIAVMLHHYRRDSGAAQEIADRLIRLATDADLEDYLAKGEIFAGWVEIERGRFREGLSRVESGFDTLREIGTPEDFPVYQCIRAAAMNHLGDQEGALAALANGRATIAAEGVNYWGAEIARREALVAMSQAEAESSFITDRLVEAKHVANGQGALALELRAGLTHLEWARSSGKTPAESLEALRAIIGRFAPDAAGRDIEDAKAALTLSTVP